MINVENPYAGQGPVLLDIGGDVGALVVTMPAELEGVEVEIRPQAPPSSETDPQRPAHDHHPVHDHHPAHDHDPVHGHDPAHGHDPGHHHSAAAPHDHAGFHLPHVAVVPRPVDGIEVYSLVFPELVEGDYELYRRPNGPVELTVTVTGGQVTESDWPVNLQSSISAGSEARFPI